MMLESSILRGDVQTLLPCVTRLPGRIMKLRIVLSRRNACQRGETVATDFFLKINIIVPSGAKIIRAFRRVHLIEKIPGTLHPVFQRLLKLGMGLNGRLNRVTSLIFRRTSNQKPKHQGDGENGFHAADTYNFFVKGQPILCLG